MPAMEQMRSDQLRHYVEQAWDLLDERQKKEVVGGIHRTMLKGVRDSLEPKAREIVMGYLRDLVLEELESRTEEMRARVVQEIDARWESHVEKLVEHRLSEAIQKIKQELTR